MLKGIVQKEIGIVLKKEIHKSSEPLKGEEMVRKSKFVGELLI